MKRGAAVFVLTVTVACASVEACGSDEPYAAAVPDGGSSSDGSSGSTLDGSTKTDAAPFVPGTPCVLRDGGPDAEAYFDLMLDGVNREPPGEVKVGVDVNNHVYVAAGFPTLTRGSSNSDTFQVLFEPG